VIAGARKRFASLPTAAKLLLILTAALLPIGLALMWIAQTGIGGANEALRSSAMVQARSASRSVESLIARNALALRIAANGAFAEGPEDACTRAQRSLAIAPAVARRFELQSPDGRTLCSVGEFVAPRGLPFVAPGDISLRVGDDNASLIMRVGVIDGMATAPLTAAELRSAALDRSERIDSLVIRDAERATVIARSPLSSGQQRRVLSDWPLGDGELTAQIGYHVPTITTRERLVLLLPLLMWVMAALITWLLVTRLLIRPLKQLERAVIQYKPGETALALPSHLGPATEIQQLGDSFGRAVARVEESESEMAAALDGQRRLVREVHHRVKNNLQVVASLLNIHGRTAETTEARAAYAAIGRRVGALSIVHRNHFAEMEDNRGIALRPLLAELAAELRGGAPDAARKLSIELELEQVNTTQDVAVSVAFLMTEMVEFAMLNCPSEPVEIALRRTSELTARLALASPVLNLEEAQSPDKQQFERIIGGLAKQLRSPLERKLGRYSVDLPVFPES
jgi:two-component sensor histidine kinase